MKTSNIFFAQHQIKRYFFLFISYNNSLENFWSKLYRVGWDKAKEKKKRERKKIKELFIALQSGIVNNDR